MNLVDVKVNRRGTNPISDYKLYKSYLKHLSRIKPSVILTFTIKPNIYGGMAAKKLNIPYVANITGLGTAIEDGGLMSKVILYLYKKSMKKSFNDYVSKQQKFRIFSDTRVLFVKNIC